MSRQSPASSSSSSKRSAPRLPDHSESSRATDASTGTHASMGLRVANTSEGTELTFRVVWSRKLLLGALALLVSVFAGVGSCTLTLADLAGVESPAGTTDR